MVTIRTATVDDAEHIAAIHNETWQAVYADVMPRQFLDGLDLVARTNMWRRAAGFAPPFGLFIADIDGDVTGFASVGPFRDADGNRDDSVGEVFAIYVAPGHWSTGTGLALMRTGVDHLAGNGLTEVRLWVVTDNPRARRFYERFGFVADGVQRVEDFGADYPGAKPVDEMRYTLHVR